MYATPRPLCTLRLLPLFSVKIYRLPDFRNVAGDYLPFTWLEDGEDIRQVRGADIEMAKSLAQAMGVRAEFVKTTWPTLLDDLRVCMVNAAKNDQARVSSYCSRAGEPSRFLLYLFSITPLPDFFVQRISFGSQALGSSCLAVAHIFWPGLTINAIAMLRNRDPVAHVPFTVDVRF
jgi:hypothetical protein